MTEQEQPDAQRSTLEAHEARVQRFIQRYPDEDPEELRMHQIAIDRENNELPPEVEATLNFSDDEPLGD